MPQDHSSPPEPENDAVLIHLVDGFIENRLNEEEKCQLEKRLLQDERAMDYCADRIGFHADIQQLLQPVRVEVIQKRHFVFERNHGLPRFTLRESQATRIGTPDSNKFIEIPPHIIDAENFRKRSFLIGAIILTLVTALVFYLLWNQAKNIPIISPEPTTRLTLRNPSFESTDLSGDEDAFSYILNDWQDLFLTPHAGICEIKRFSNGRISPPSGSNVAVLNPGSYLTQRLRMSDDTPLLVSPGLHLRIQGKVLVENADNPVPMQLALRVVQSIIPEMVQYEPIVVSISVREPRWQQFQADFILPVEPDKLILKPSYVMVKSKEDQEFNILGEPLTLSIDNRTKTTFYLDDLSMEVVPSPETK